MTRGVFSEYEIDAIGFKFAGDSGYTTAACIGSVGEEMETRNVTKNCRGVVAKRTTRGTGNGTLTISLHVPYAIFIKAYNMDQAELAAGVNGYGTPSAHRAVSLVVHVTDEDGDEKFKAYPNCIVGTNGISRSTENGAEEVAEVELEVMVQPDDYGFGLYEALANALSSTIKNAWMTSFTPDLVRSSVTLNTVSLTLTNCTATGPSAFKDGEDVIIRLAAESGHSLPSTVTVTIGEESATAGDDYIYNQSTGLLAIPAADGDVAVTVSAT